MKTVSFEELLTRAKVNGSKNRFMETMQHLKEMALDSDAGEVEVSVSWLKPGESAKDFVPSLVLRVRDVR